MPHEGTFFAALGSKIFVFTNQRCALVYDTRTDGLSVGPHAPAQTLLCDSGIAVPVGGTLYALCRTASPTSRSSTPWRLDELLQRPKTEGWSWKSLPAPPPTFSHNQFVTSHAVHPDGRTIFMTTAYRESPGLHVGTFSFDTESCVWRWHGELRVEVTPTSTPTWIGGLAFVGTGTSVPAELPPAAVA